jgi:hypothetical protein
MGLDMHPLGKPKPGFEKRFLENFEMITKDKFPKPSVSDMDLGKSVMTKQEILDEWFTIQIQAYETIKAPRVGSDKEAD